MQKLTLFLIIRLTITHLEIAEQSKRLTIIDVPIGFHRKGNVFDAFLFSQFTTLNMEICLEFWYLSS